MRIREAHNYVYSDRKAAHTGRLFYSFLNGAFLIASKISSSLSTI
jgi:hypothetical protein